MHHDSLATAPASLREEVRRCRADDHHYGCLSQQHTTPPPPPAAAGAPLPLLRLLRALRVRVLQVNRFLDALSRLYASEGKALVCFERVLHARRGETPVHTHMQVIAVPLEAARRAQDLWTTEGQFKGVPFVVMPEEETLQAAVENKEAAAATATASAGAAEGAPAAAGDAAVGPRSGLPATREYLYAEVPAASALPVDGASASLDGPALRVSSSRLLHLVPPGAKHPVQFGREVLCRLLACPDRLHWKACAVGVEGETAAATAFRERFAPFDFTADM